MNDFVPFIAVVAQSPSLRQLAGRIKVHSQPDLVFCRPPPDWAVNTLLANLRLLIVSSSVVQFGLTLMNLRASNKL